MILPRFIRKMILARQGADLPVRLNRRRIYILPTRAGTVFAFFLLAMLVAAINYTNNLAFLLTFLLGSISILSAIHAYANLAGLEVESGRLFPAFCGDDARLQLFFRAGGRERRRISVRIGAAEDEFSLHAGAGRELDLNVPTVRRGPLPLGRLVIATRYPLGLFRAWSPLVLPVSGLVYPRALAVDSLDRHHPKGGGDQEGLGAVSQSGEFGGVRPHRPEDGVSRISWKASARGAGLFAKEFRSGAAGSLVFDWDEVRASGYEERISLLAGLVREAERLGLNYGLRLPGLMIEPGSGASWAHRCLEALALLPELP
jgi:uncharacterized protein (DUF58 family)